MPRQHNDVIASRLCKAPCDVCSLRLVDVKGRGRVPFLKFAGGSKEPKTGNPNVVLWRLHEYFWQFALKAHQGTPAAAVAAEPQKSGNRKSGNQERNQRNQEIRKSGSQEIKT